MSEFELTSLTLSELAKRTDPKGNPAKIAQVLQQRNQILEDIPWTEANETFSHRTTRAAAEPSGTYRMINYGIAVAAGETTVVTDVVGLLESYSKIDKRLVEAAANPMEFRAQEDMMHVSGLGKTFAESLVYGNASDTAAEFTGLAARMDSASDTNVIDAGGSGSTCTSIYLVTWGLDTAHGIYGKGSTAGLQAEDLGIQTWESSSLVNRWYVTHFRWEGGLVVRDPACIGRIASIQSTGTSNIFNEDDLIDLIGMYAEVRPTTRLYVNRTVMTQMWKRLKDKNNVYFTRNDGLDAGGMPISFNGIPVRLVEQITNTETAL
jgi:hypothetical protein